ncbi:IS3 family transposase [Streptosporangium sp. NBC_01755]|uniref:IS3 family transposase n=1 Tax=unclassified Streptosporangium TaxID=2632669 RepID=UPI002DDBB2F4|nr:MULTISPECIES: IS3 family transposase [unclassified Streptosporangium]WSA28829.1 IS3 family transposase [Streptosporangium sp. NBC_01810]WSC99725.1 IS3 family transposase [Streptosporangium sp. NBC_01755]
MTELRDEARQQLEPRVGIQRSCKLTGVNRSTLYRRREPKNGKSEMVRPSPPNALSKEEADELIGVLNSEEFADKSPRQVWAALLDRGVYLASPSTMYRELRTRGQVRERRAQARHEAKKKPQLIARNPNEVWSWDITKLQGPVRGRFFDLYVMIDIYSRCVVHWELHTRESGELAQVFIENAIRANGGIAPNTIHSDRGTAMTSISVTELLSDLGIVKSHSRPKVSNDNPYSEAQFKTMNYCPVFPERFGSFADARSFCRRFFEYYNHEHYHSGIGLHTPFSVHIGTAQAVQDKRATTIERFRAANPHRFTRTPSLPKIPAVAWINKPDENQDDQTGEAAA